MRENLYHKLQVKCSVKLVIILLFHDGSIISVMISYLSRHAYGNVDFRISFSLTCLLYELSIIVRMNY